MSEPQERLHALDAVRATALLLGIVLHGTMSFMPALTTGGFPISDSSQSEFLQGTFFVIHIFRMTAFFAIAGFFAHLLYHRRGATGFIRDRSRRVLVPLIVGWMVLAPAVMAIFYWAIVSSGKTPMAPPGAGSGAASVPLMHLWFLYVLALLYVTVLAARHLSLWLVDPGELGDRVDTMFARLVRSPVLAIALAVPAMTALYFHEGWIPFGGIPTPDMSLIPNLPAFTAFAVAFSFGWLLHRQIALLNTFSRSWPLYLAASVVLVVAASQMVLRIDGLQPGGADNFARLIYAAVYATASWTCTFALLGAAMRYLGRDRPMVRYLADASYWMYLLHLPLIFGLQQLMSSWSLHWSVKFPLLLTITTAILLITYHWLVRSTYVGEVLNGRRYPRQWPGSPTVAAPPATQVISSDPDVLASLRGVHKRYGATVALNALDLDVARGELVAVLGPNGAGKSTAISLLLGLHRADAGDISLFGMPPESLEARRRTGVMMQEVTMPPELRVLELIELTASYYASPMTSEAAMQMTHITELAQRTYGKLSGGQKRQVQFAMAICGRPQLLFLDEPTVGLDVQAREMMWNTIRLLVRGGCSVVLTTHYLEEAEALADRVIVMAKGKVVASGSVADMTALVGRRRIQCITCTPLSLIGSWSGVDNVANKDGRVEITTLHAEAVVRQLLAADSNLSQLEVRRAGLSEAFTELTQEAA